jgi:hypothetical protein
MSETTGYTNFTDWGAHAARLLVSAASPRQSVFHYEAHECHGDILNQENKNPGNGTSEIQGKDADSHRFGIRVSSFLRPSTFVLRHFQIIHAIRGLKLTPFPSRSLLPSQLYLLCRSSQSLHSLNRLTIQRFNAVKARGAHGALRALTSSAAIRVHSCPFLATANPSDGGRGLQRFNPSTLQRFNDSTAGFRRNTKPA